MATADERIVTGELLVLLRDIREEQRAIRRLLERRTLSRGDRALLERTLPAASGVLGSGWFRISELFKLPAPALNIALQGVSQSRLGSAFSRAEGVAIRGLVVRRGGTESGAALWSIEASIDGGSD